MKATLTHVVRKVFEKNPDSVLSHKQVCVLIDVRENALRNLVYEILEELSKDGKIKRTAHAVYTS